MAKFGVIDMVTNKKKDITKANKRRGDKTNVRLAAPLEAVLSPINRFINAETSGGIVLLLATIAALIWANTMPESYTGFWSTRASVGIGVFSLEHTLLEWVNDGLMAIFFLQVGLEIKREMQVGDLSSFGQAILPVIAAAGGMIVPAILFSLCAMGTPYTNGWGIPVATDIAFAIGIISLLGKRVPTSLKVFLVALAIADDLGAVLVIAFFYSSHLNVTALMSALAVFAVLILINKLGIRSLIAYSLGGLVLWLCVLHSGIHASLAGVMLAITIPTWTAIDKNRLSKTLSVVKDALDRRSNNEDGAIGDAKVLNAIENLHESATRALPPLVIMEHSITTFVAMIIMPLFALANSGVIVTRLEPGFLSDTVTHGIALGLILGKPIGITLGTFLTIKCGLAKLPRGANWLQLLGAGMLGGIGFTMSIFVSNLALGNGPHLDTAKMAILCSSTTAGLLGFIWLYLHPQQTTAAAESESQTPKTESKPASKAPAKA
ncbi:MAG: Na+/H+ antiporter NhaA [Candidatus Bruticola sp.]